MKTQILTFCVVATLFFNSIFAASIFSNALGDHMVLQRGPEAATVWGTVGPRETVTVRLNGQTATTAVASPNGSWRADLPPQNAGGPHTIEASSPTAGKAVLMDVYFGDVYICSGQSNMQFSVQGGFNASAEIAAAAKYPQIRVFTVGQGTVSDTPLEQLTTIEQGWSVATPQSVGNGVWSFMSAVCWFAGRDLYDQYKVPVGLVSSNWGGTIIQAWSPPDALKKCNASALAPLKRNMNFEDEVFSLDPALRVDPNRDTVLYNAMIYPLRFMKLRGVFWYQGENNVGQSGYYSCAFPAMIDSWRSVWGQQKIPLSFFFVQLAAYTQGGPYGEQLALLRQSQLSALALQYVGYATAIDLGDLGSPEGNIHPRDKQTVGVRLSAATRAIAFADRIVYQGPRADSFHIIQNAPNVQIEIRFRADTLGSGLVIRSNVDCPAALSGSKECGWLEIQTSDNMWRNVTANPEIRGNTLVLTLRDVPNSLTVTGTRYAFADWPVCTLYNREGFPTLPWNLKRSAKPKF